MADDSASQRHFIEAERIYLRGVRLADVNDRYYQWMNDPDVTRYLETRFYPNSLESLRQYVSEKLGDRNSVFLAIVLKEDDRHIGNIKLGPIDWVHRVADIGLLIGEKACWGKGYATEAIDALCGYAFNVLNLHKVTAGAYDRNVGSVRAFLRTGFQEEGVRKAHYHLDGLYVNGILLGRVRPA
jgi:RimJ/RimL family protein N-acetyltransferase